MANTPTQSALPQTKQARADLSTQRLLEAAAALIAEKGYERTTLADIGRRAGYSHGLVTQRFGSKEGLLAALIEFALARWASLVQNRRGDHEREEVADVIAATRTQLRHDPDLMRGLYALIFESFKPLPVVHDQMIENHRAVRDRIADDVRGRIRGVDPAVFAGYCVAALRGLEYEWLLDPDGFDLDKMLRWLDGHIAQDLAGPPAVHR